MLLVVGSGTTLMGHLGARTVPGPLQPLANYWVRSGRDPKWVNVSLWILFSLTACAFFAGVLIPLYQVFSLGTGFK